MELYHPELAEAAKQLGEETYAHDMLYKELDEKFKMHIIDRWQWISEHVALDDMKRNISRQFTHVHSAMNANIWVKDHWEKDKALNKIYLETAYPDVDVMLFCVMQ